MSCTINDAGEIVLTGVVGSDFWEDGFTAGEVIGVLAQVGRNNPAIIRLNSGGGYATEGAAIHSAISAHKGSVTVIVEGVAASAATLITSAADEVLMSLGAVMMIHDPATITWGTADEHRISTEMLDALGSVYAEIYAEKTGGTVEAMRALMKAETWMTGKDAVAKGFADGMAPANENDAPAEPTAFAYGVYARAPRKITAMAKAKGWTATPAKPTSQAQPPKTKEPTMTTDAAAADTARTEGATAATARIKAIMTAPEAKGREAMAEHLAYDTDTTAEAAVALMKVAPDGGGEIESPEAFAARKARASTEGDGLGAPGSVKPDVRAAWSKVTNRVNARLKK